MDSYNMEYMAEYHEVQLHRKAPMEVSKKRVKRYKRKKIFTAFTVAWRSLTNAISSRILVKGRGEY